MPAKRELTMRQLRYMLRLHHDGVSAREIGRTLGVARSTIHAGGSRPQTRAPFPPSGADAGHRRPQVGPAGTPTPRGGQVGVTRGHLGPQTGGQ
jgi:hypothetical protein